MSIHAHLHHKKKPKSCIRSMMMWWSTKVYSVVQLLQLTHKVNQSWSVRVWQQGYRCSNSTHTSICHRFCHVAFNPMGGKRTARTEFSWLQGGDSKRHVCTQCPEANTHESNQVFIYAYCILDSTEQMYWEENTALGFTFLDDSFWSSGP